MPLQVEGGKFPTGALDSEQRSDVLLAQMLGLNGAVAMGDQLDRGGPLAAGNYDERRGALHRQLMLTMVKRRSAIRTRVERRYAQACEGDRPLSGAAVVLDFLQDQGALIDAQSRPLSAKRIAERYRGLLVSTLSVVRKELYWLREDTLRALHTAGPVAQRWIALDKVLDSALEQATSKAHRTMELQVMASFEAQLSNAIAHLSQEIASSDMQAWFQRGGIIGRFMHESRRLCWALLDTEWNRLRALVEACCGPLIPLSGHSSTWLSDRPDSHELEAP